MIFESFTNLSLLANLKIAPPRQSIGFPTINIRMRIPNQVLYALETLYIQNPTTNNHQIKYMNPRTRSMNENGLENEKWPAGGFSIVEIMEVGEGFVERSPVIRVEP
jgi:hypothetical protein